MISTPGLSDPSAVEHNRSRYHPRADTLNMPYGIAALGGQLICADTANSRLLGYAIDFSLRWLLRTVFPWYVAGQKK